MKLLSNEEFFCNGREMFFCYFCASKGFKGIGFGAALIFLALLYARFLKNDIYIFLKTHKV